jgi:3-oxoacyl-[acyl-carrier protein] reductase
MKDSSAPLAGQVALVTNATGGIGEAILVRLAQDGANVVLAASSREEAERVAEAVGAGFPERQVLALGADMSSIEGAAGMIDEALKTFESVDILVNNASLMETDGREGDALAASLKGLFTACRAAARHMLRQRSGRIVNVTGAPGPAGQAHCAALEGGVVALTRTMAKELAPRGITVNAVAPGFVDSDTTAATGDAASGVTETIPLGRIGGADEIAAVVAFLCGPGGAYVTGEVIRADGGLAIGR